MGWCGCECGCGWRNGTRQVTVDSVTVEVVVKLLEVKFDAPATEDGKEGEEEINFDDGTGDTILLTTEAP